MAAERRRFGHGEVFALIAALSFLVARFAPVLSLPFACPWKLLTGVPCVSCGMTHAFVALAHGQVTAAFAANPLGATLAATVWGFALVDAARIVAGRAWPRFQEPELVRRAAWVVAPLAAGLNWIFLVTRAR